MMMGCSMFDTAKELANASILSRNPDMTELERRIILIRRLYDDVLSKEQMARVIDHVRKLSKISDPRP